MTLDEAIKHCNEVACKHDECATEHKQLAQWLIELKGYKEQKLFDNLKPKFKVGDWIITNKNHIWYIDETPETTSYLYRLVNQYGKVEVAEFEIVDEKARLWTIQDAKNGDVLAYNDGSLTIFHYRLSGLDAGLYMSHVLLIDKIELKQTCAINNVHPATKEQRDQLEKAMADTGYTFNFEKKELKKIEQKPAWSEEDESHIRYLIECLEYCKKGVALTMSTSTSQEYINWLKSLRPQSKNEWDKNDELNRQDTIRLLTDAKERYLQTDASIPKCIKWLENLSPQKQWKPSEEQMKALKDACDEH